MFGEFAGPLYCLGAVIMRCADVVAEVHKPCAAAKQQYAKEQKMPERIELSGDGFAARLGQQDDIHDAVVSAFGRRS